MKRESDIERILVDGIRKLGGRAYKWVSPGNAGVPDRIVVLKDLRPMFVELKTDRGTLTALQKVQLGRLRLLGQDVHVLYGEDGVRRFLNSVECLLGAGRFLGSAEGLSEDDKEERGETE